MAEYKPFQFEAHDAVRENVPLLLGLSGASGSGKTYTALRLAHGIQSIVGGDIYFIDTENRRGLHYAGAKSPANVVFKFKHVPFPAPYGSLKYRDALRYCVAQKPGVIVVDSMSHEHESEGGLIDFHEREMERLSKGNDERRDAVNMLAWSKPKADRRQLLLEIQKLQTNVIFCYRAKTTAKPVKVGAKTEVIQQGFMPIAGDEFVFEMTLNAMLYPHSNGVPTWESEFVGERMMIKLPDQFRALAQMKTPMDEEMGARLAKWARGGAPTPADGAETKEAAPSGSRPTRTAAASSAAAGRDSSASATPASTASAEETSSQPQPDAASIDGENSTEQDDFPGDRPAAGDQPRYRESDIAQDVAPEPQGAAESPGTQEIDETPPAPSADGFAVFAMAVAEAIDWTKTIREPMRALTGTDSWAQASPDQHAMARHIAFTRLKELVDGGLKFDFLTDAHAFRCYIEWEEDVPAFEGNLRAFKTMAAYRGLPAQSQASIDKAADVRLSSLRTFTRAAPSAAEFA